MRKEDRKCLEEAAAYEDTGGVPERALGTGRKGKEADLMSETRCYSEGYFKSEDSLEYESDKIGFAFLKASSS